MWFFAILSCQPTIQRAPPEDDTAPTGLTVTGVAPSSGPASGGTSVSVRGTGFSDASEVSVGSVACASMAWLSDTELLCVTPPGAAGETTLAVTDAGETATIAFSYLPVGDTGDPPDTGDTGTRDTADTADTGDTSDTADTGIDTADTADTGTDSGDSADTAAIVPIDYCHLQYPCAQTVAAGVASEGVYGWVYQAGVTEGAGEAAGITVQVGVGPDGSDPAVDAGWSWAAMAYNTDKDGLSSGDLANDEYEGPFAAPGSAGTYDYCVRASADGGASWTYCDGGGASCPGSGSDDGYSAADAGALTVE